MKKSIIVEAVHSALDLIADSGTVQEYYLLNSLCASAIDTTVDSVCNSLVQIGINIEE